MTADRKHISAFPRAWQKPDTSGDRSDLRRLLFELADDALILVDHEWRIQAANPRAASLFPELSSIEPGVAMPSIVVMDRDGGLDDLRRIAGESYSLSGRTVRLGDLAFDLSEIVTEDLRLLRLSETTERFARERRILGAIESIPGGFTLFDPSDRLILANQTYLREYSDSFRSGGNPIGAKGADLIAASIRAGLAQSGSHEDTETFIARRLARRINPPAEPHVYRRPNGQWAAVYERRTPDGGLATIRLDITAQKRAESMLSDSIEHIGEALSLWDENDRLILYNSRYADLHFPGRQATDFRGLAFEDMLKQVMGAVYEAPTDIEEYAAAFRRSIEIWRSDQNYSRELKLVDGRVIGVRCLRTRGGGRAAICTDVTTVRRTEDALREAIESFGDGFVLSGPDDRIIAHNGRYLEMFESLRGRSLVGRSTAEIALALRRQAAGKSKVWSESRRRGRSEGNDDPVEVSMPDGRLLSFRDQRTRSGGIATLITDITKDKEAEDKLRRSEASLKTIVDGSLQATVIHLEGKVLFCNSAFRDLWSYSDADGLLEQPASPDGSEPSLFGDLGEGSAPVSGEERWVKNAGGRRICVDYRSLPIDWLGKSATMTAIIDITERVYAHFRLQRSESKFRDITACATDFHWEIDRDFRISEVADRVRDVFDVDPSLFVGASILKMFASGAGREQIAKTFKALRDGQPFRGHVHTILLPDGKKRIVRSNGTPFISEGKLKGYRGASTDITAEVADSARRQEIERFIVLGNRVGMIAHEFNNQLQAIQSFSEFIRDRIKDKGDPDLIAWNRFVLRATGEASVVANRVLASSRADMATRIPLDIANEVRGLMDVQMNSMIDREIRYTNDLPPGARVKISPEEVNRIVSNLTINANHATKAGGIISVVLEDVTTATEIPQPAPDVAPAPPGRYVRMTIQDNGEGMAEDIRKRIFEQFFTTKGHLGTGLGLPIVYEIVKSMKGAIEVATQLGVGTIFRIYLPFYSEAEESSP